MSTENNSTATTATAAASGGGETATRTVPARTILMYSTHPGSTISKPGENDKSAGGGAKKPTTGKLDTEFSPQDTARMTVLGLGRGVDGTDPTPWLNKGSFQVRELTPTSLMRTDEGGSIQSYVREVSSVRSQQSQLTTSIEIEHTPITIGVDGEYSRSYSTSKKSVGKKIVNETIAFTSSFDDVLTDMVTCSQPGRKGTFEYRLCQWVTKHFKALHPEDDPVLALEDMLKTCPAEVKNNIQRQCYEFINYFHVTHYVSSIELGAAEYVVLSHEEYEKQFSASADLRVKVVETDVSHKIAWSKLQQTSELKRIGKINKDDTVDKGEDGEAVVGVTVHPITTLVQQDKVRAVLRAALLQYMKKQGDRSKGPFLISCNNDGIFLTVQNNQVMGTANVSDAKEFYIVPSLDGDHPHEFILAYHGPRTMDGKLDPIPLYLNADVNMCGHNGGPLRLKFNVRECNSRLTLHSRLIKHYQAMDIEPWLRGDDVFYINCARRVVKRNGYICVNHNPGRRARGQYAFKTACVPSIRHQDRPHTHMLFRLISPTDVPPTGQQYTDEEKAASLSTHDPLEGEGEGRTQLLTTSGKLQTLPPRKLKESAM